MSNKYMRGLLYAAQKGRCFYCNIKMTMRGKSRDLCTIDHIITKADGGSNERKNLVGACLVCNGVRGRVDHQAFIRFVKIYGRNRSFGEVIRHISHEDYMQDKGMWDEIRSRAFLSMKANDQIPLPEKQILPQPGYRMRRPLLHLTRRGIEEIVYNVPYYERNVLWLNHLRKEKLNGYAEEEYTAGTSDDPDGSGRDCHDDGRERQWRDRSYSA